MATVYGEVATVYGEVATVYGEVATILRGSGYGYGEVATVLRGSGYGFTGKWLRFYGEVATVFLKKNLCSALIFLLSEIFKESANHI